MKTSKSIHFFVISIILLIISAMNLNVVSAQEIPLINPSFELPGTGTIERDWEKIEGWSISSAVNSGVRKNESYGPVNGDWYAYQKCAGEFIFQETDHTITAGQTYTLQLWVRSVNNAKDTARTTVEVRLYYDSTTIVSASADVNAPQLKGAAATTPNDDGANVWIDGDHRHQFADVHMIQPLTDDPIEDEWTIVQNSGYEAIEGLGWAVGPVIAGDQKYIYGTLYRDNPSNFYSSIPMVKVLASQDQDYTWSEPDTLISHSGTEFPWVEDPHCFYDEDTGRLWMAWGGGTCYISELDPTTGLFTNPQADPEYETHPEGMHIAAATWPEQEGWNGDQYSRPWMEGAAIYKHNGYWYYFGSYGHLGYDYTIRYGRGTNPIGPFYDKHGQDLMAFDEERDEYGNTILLGDEGGQLVPGHAHPWEEEGDFYIGYDYMKEYAQGYDYMGIRKLYWVDDWPTIWMPVTVTFDANDHPEAIGKKLGVSFHNTGEESSKVGVDYVSISRSEDTGFEQSQHSKRAEQFGLLQNFPNPFNPATEIQYTIPQSSHVRLNVYNQLGEEIEQLVDGIKGAGVHKITFDASELPSGVYYYCLKTDDFTKMRKCLLMK